MNQQIEKVKKKCVVVDLPHFGMPSLILEENFWDIVEITSFGEIEPVLAEQTFIDLLLSPYTYEYTLSMVQKCHLYQMSAEDYEKSSIAKNASSLFRVIETHGVHIDHLAVHTFTTHVDAKALSKRLPTVGSVAHIRKDHGIAEVYYFIKETFGEKAVLKDLDFSAWKATRVFR